MKRGAGSTHEAMRMQPDEMREKADQTTLDHHADLVVVLAAGDAGAVRGRADLDEEDRRLRERWDLEPGTHASKHDAPLAAKATNSATARADLTR